jgi:hypothetical protein
MQRRRIARVERKSQWYFLTIAGFPVVSRAWNDYRIDDKKWLSFLLVGIPAISKSDFETPLYISANLLRKKIREVKHTVLYVVTCCFFYAVRCSFQKIREQHAQKSMKSSRQEICQIYNLHLLPRGPSLSCLDEGLWSTVLYIMTKMERKLIG